MCVEGPAWPRVFPREPLDESRPIDRTNDRPVSFEPTRQLQCQRRRPNLRDTPQDASRGIIRVANVVNVAIAEDESFKAMHEVMGWIGRQGFDISMNQYIIQAVYKAINISMKSVAPTDKDTTTVYLFDGLSITHQSVDQFSLYQTALVTSLAGSPELRKKWKTQIVAVAPLSTGAGDAQR
jgi:hypothetical protein